MPRAIASTRYQRGARQKMTFKCRIQSCSSHVNRHSTGWIIFFPRWSPPKDLESICNLGMEEKNFFKNGKQLFLSQSFIVSSSKTLHKSYKGWRQEQQNNKRNTNDQSRLNTIN